jgi:alpha-tubulin suppressor-like RCC1 family protein
VACGLDHTLAVAAGRVFAWGQGESGQLGLGEELLEAFRPTEVRPIFSLSSAGPSLFSRMGRTCVRVARRL